MNLLGHREWRATRTAIRILLTELISRNHDYWPTIHKMVTYLRRNPTGPLRIAS